jgi:dTDP-glucose 4,6-dehydratase
VYNVGGGEELPNLQVIDTLCAVVDAAFAANPTLATRFPDAAAAKGKPTNSLKTYVKDRPGHDRRYAIDETKIRSELGYHASMSFAEGLDKTVNWYLTNEAWWQAVMDGSYRQWLDKNYTR